MMNKALSLAPLALLAACATSPATTASTAEPASHAAMGHDMASAPLLAGDGRSAGTVRWMAMGADLHVMVDASGLAPGSHGLHLHATGRCDGPAFQTAGAHWNPTSRQHGRNNPAGFHVGDLGNLVVGADGNASANIHVPGAAGIADADGTSLVVHAKADDEKTDPSGASGDRIACAVLATPR